MLIFWASIQVHVFIAITNLVACTLFSMIRVYHHSKWRLELPRLSITSLLCMLLGILVCLIVLNNESGWYFQNVEKYCDWSIKLCVFTYTLHRILLYVFIIFRIEIVNKLKIIGKRTITFGKFLIAANGIYMLTCSMIFPHGEKDLVMNKGCSFHVWYVVLFIGVAFDVFIYVGGTYLFIRMLRHTFRLVVEDENLRLILRKTVFWAAISLMSTVIAMLIVGFVDGAAGVVSFDCSVTSFSLLMMMYPVREGAARRVAPDSSVN